MEDRKTADDQDRKDDSAEDQPSEVQPNMPDLTKVSSPERIALGALRLAV